jgi:transposase
VKRERLDFLADNPFYTKRFAYYVGRRCRTATVQDIAKELKLDWHTVKELDKQYMKAQLAKAGKPRPKVIGIDEISIRKGHTDRIVVSDLENSRPIWFGRQDRSQPSLTQFFEELGKPKSEKIRLAVMDIVETLSQRNADVRSSSGYSLRQVSCAGPLGRCARSSGQE